MLIKSIELIGYIPLTFNGVSSIKASFTEIMQIIIGDNGCGKSSLLRELNPIPAVSTDYLKNGKKVLELIHNSDEYILTSDFGNKKGAHSFIKNGQELNISGTTGVQNELVETHLNYTSQIRDITYINYHICTMSKSDRKNLLLSINPIDFTPILDKHKKVCSKIRECKNNLTMLYQRKTDLESRMLGKDVLETMTKEKLSLQEQSNMIDKILFSIDQSLLDMKNHAESLPNISIDLKDIISKIKRIKFELSFCSCIDRNDTETQYRKTIRDISHLEANIETYSNQIVLVTNEINKYEEYLTSGTNAITKTDIEKEILEIDNLIKAYPVLDDIYILNDETELSKCDSILDKFIQILTNIETVNIHLLNKKQCSQIDAAINKCQSILWDIKTKLERATNDYTYELSRYGSETPNEKCNLDCIFRRNFKDAEASKKRAEVTYKELSQVLNKKLDKYTRVLNKLQIVATNQHSVQSYLDELKYLFESHPWLSNCLDGKKVIDLINTDAMRIVRNLRFIIEASKQSIEINKLKTKRIKFVTQLEALANTNTPTDEFIKSTLKDKKELHQKLLSEITEYQIAVEALKIFKNKLEFFNTSKEYTEQVRHDIQKAEHISALNANIEYYEELKRVCVSARNKLQEQLRSFEVNLKEQESFHDRYTNEIMVNIANIEKDKKAYEHIEKALSPNSGIPHKYMIKYLNSLIHNVNHFISRVWTYDLIIDQVDENDPLDFTFSATIKEKKLSDISKCSTGQKNIIDLAWIIAIMLHMKLNNDYPLYLDEADSGLDMQHRHRFLEFLNDLSSDNFLQQMFVINHHAPLHSGLIHSETMCLSSENILVPSVYNQHVSLM